MSSLTMVEASLPPGFRFHPRDDELVCDYLINKWNGCDHSSFLLQIDLNKCEPWDIPETVCVGGKEWYFYSQRDRKYATGLRTNRATASGYWKATGKDRPVLRGGSLVGMRKTLVFYQGRAPKGNKTNWVMHEFRVEGPFFTPPTFSALSKQEDWVLCRVFLKKKESRSKSDQAEYDSTNNSVEETTSSSTLNTLPPLMDSYITFHPTQPNNNINNNNNNNINNNNININNNNNNNNNHNEQVQVPCFSMRSSSDNYNYPIIMQQFDHPNNDSANDEYNNINQGALSCDKKVVEAFLTHLTKMESSLPSPTLNATPHTPYASLPTHMWNHY